MTDGGNFKEWWGGRDIHFLSAVQVTAVYVWTALHELSQESGSGRERQRRQTALRPVHTCLKILGAAFQETCGVCRRELIEIFHNSENTPLSWPSPTLNREPWLCYCRIETPPKSHPIPVTTRVWAGELAAEHSAHSHCYFPSFPAFEAKLQ